MLSKTASTLALLTAVVHILIGGEDALAPLLAAELALPAKGAMHACWHIVSVFLIWSVVEFWMADRTVLHFGLLWIASALVFTYVGLRQVSITVSKTSGRSFSVKASITRNVAVRPRSVAF